MIHLLSSAVNKTMKQAARYTFAGVICIYCFCWYGTMQSKEKVTHMRL